MTKEERQKLIKEIIQKEEVSSQEALLTILIEKGYDITQATLSRDMKNLKIIKAPSFSGNYIYQLSEPMGSTNNDETASLSAIGFVDIEFSGSLAVIKTRPGYAMAIAGEIDQKTTNTILGTVAGDDTILLIPKEGISRKEVINSLSLIIPTI